MRERIVASREAASQRPPTFDTEPATLKPTDNPVYPYIQIEKDELTWCTSSKLYNDHN